MSLIAKEASSSSFAPVPTGVHLACCYRIVDLGTQKTSFQGKDNFLHKILIQFEIHSDDESGMPLMTTQGEPMSISKRYTLSLGEKSSLRKDLQSWRGKNFTPDELRGFELQNLLGAWCMLNVTEQTGADGKSYTNISAITPVPAAMRKTLPDMQNESWIFSLDDFNQKLFEQISPKLQETIKSSPEYQALGQRDAYTAPVDDIDDVPF
jgi:hypothetical protein